MRSGAGSVFIAHLGVLAFIVLGAAALWWYWEQMPDWVRIPLACAWGITVVFQPAVVYAFTKDHSQPPPK